MKSMWSFIEHQLCLLARSCDAIKLILFKSSLTTCSLCGYRSTDLFPFIHLKSIQLQSYYWSDLLNSGVTSEDQTVHGQVGVPETNTATQKSAFYNFF